MTTKEFLEVRNTFLWECLKVTSMIGMGALAVIIGITIPKLLPLSKEDTSVGQLVMTLALFIPAMMNWCALLHIAVAVHLKFSEGDPKMKSDIVKWGMLSLAIIIAAVIYAYSHRYTTNQGYIIDKWNQTIIRPKLQGENRP